MKKVLLIAFLIIPFLGFSQETKIPIDGFLGVKFGSSKMQVTAAIKAKGGVLDKQHSTQSKLFFAGVKLGERKISVLSIAFYNDKVYSCGMSFLPESEPKTLDYYNDLVSDLNEKYGEGDSGQDFKSPFKYGDGHEIVALHQGYAEMFTDWKSGTNSIQVSIWHTEDNLGVKLVYTDDAAEEKATEKDKAKAKSDL